MSELETIFYGLATSKDSASNIPCLDFDDFKSALTEVIEKIRVTDQELLDSAVNLDEVVGAYKIRDLQKEKLEKLLK